MAGVEQVLACLGESFTVKDIMVPRERLVCASDESVAPSVSAENPDYNIIPILDGGKLTCLYERDSRCFRLIRTDDLIEGATGIPELVELLRRRQFYFVLLKNEVEGYIHFSDLNHPLVKLTFYAIFEAFERRLLERLKPVKDDQLHPRRLKRIKDKMCQTRKNDVNLSLSLEQFLYFPEIVKLARSREILSLEDTEIETLRTFRNRVSHAGRLLLDNRTDLDRLADAKRICLKLLTEDRVAG